MTSMTFGQAIIISVIGLAIVFAVLVVLALAVNVVSKLVASFSKNVAPVNATTKAATTAANDTENEMQAVVIAALCEELHTTPDRLTVNYIKAI